MSTLRIPGKDSRYLAVSGQRDIDDEVMTSHSCDLEQLPMQRVVLYRSFDRPRIAHELRAMQDLDGFLRRESRRHEFPAPGESKHQVRFDESECDSQVRGNESIVDVNGRARLRFAQRAVLR